MVLPRVLIIGRHEDPHTLAVQSELKKIGVVADCFDTFRKDCFSIEISHSNSSSRLGFGDNSKELVNNYHSIWMRQKPIVPMPWWSPLDNDAARFTQQEWQNIFQSLPSFSKTTRWINHPTDQRKINYKPNQLKLAMKIGFKIPDTLLTNSSKSIFDFSRKHKKIIYKSFSGYIFSDQTGILTNLLDSKDIESNKESFKRAPGIYQEFIEKSHEARVTVVGDKIFTALVRTPTGGQGYIDWRYAQFEDVFEKYEIPLSLKNMLLTFQQEANLKYGAYDFIISPNGDWYFLECNPAGQYLWLENSLNLKISKAIANELCLGLEQFLLPKTKIDTV